MAGLAGCGRSTSAATAPTSSGATATASPGATLPAEVSTVSPASELPFTLDVTVQQVVPAPGTLPEAEVTELWRTGGDYRRIASFPLDEATLFGSVSSTPDRLDSYGAALLHESGDDTVIEVAQPDAVYREPQDGWSDGRYVVWRSAPIGAVGITAQTVTDDWAVSVCELGSGTARVLAQAAQVNGRADTPSAGGEVVPTLSRTRAYISSMFASAGGWQPGVLAVPLDGSAGAVSVASGWFPAAVPDGVLYAAGDGALPTQVMYLAEGSASPQRLWGLSSADGGWQVSGLWASPDGAWRVVAVGRGDGAAPAFLGVWAAGEPGPSRWLSTIAPSVVASVAGSHLVWGSGSTATDSEMFVCGLADWQPRVLGRAPGYSRPRLSVDGEVALVPVSDGVSAVSWRVVRWGQDRG